MGRWRDYGRWSIARTQRATSGFEHMRAFQTAERVSCTKIFRYRGISLRKELPEYASRPEAVIEIPMGLRFLFLKASRQRFIVLSLSSSVEE